MDPDAERRPGDKGTRLEQALLEHLGAPLAGVIERAFDYIRLAESEIDDFKEKFPAQAEELHATFRYLAWQLDVAAPELVYRHHARELLQRVVDGDSLCLGTQAEALMMLHATSLRSPLKTEAVTLQLRLFRAVYGDTARVVDYDGTEPWPGACDELLGEIVRKLSRDRDCDRNSR